MGCCGKAKNILSGFAMLAMGRSFSFTAGRIKRCKDCKYSYSIFRTLWCKICKCNISAASRVKDKNCPKNYWERKELPVSARKDFNNGKR